MPAIISHQLFGEDASSKLPTGTLNGQEELLAFLIANQGPDPLWWRFRCLPATAHTCHQLADRMHSSLVVDALCQMQRAAQALPANDRELGHAFVLGMGAHYLLDSFVHPLVIAQVRELVQADPTLEGTEAQLRAFIESDIDTWLLWQKRQKTVEECLVITTLASTSRVNRIAGGLIAHVARTTYAIELPASEYGKALRDLYATYRLIDPPASRTYQALQAIPGLRHLCAPVAAHRHLVFASDECASANLQHHMWRNPFTGERSHASLADLFTDALLAWPAFAERIVSGDPDRIAPMVAGIDYFGNPTADAAAR